MRKDALIIKLMKKMAINFTSAITAVDGELDVGVVVRLGTPYILSHVYQDELDDRVNTLTAGTSGMDRFAEPKDGWRCKKKICQYWESTHTRTRKTFY